MRPTTVALGAVAAGAAAGAAAVAYAALYEVNAFVLREVTVPVLAPGSRPLRILHISDVHMVPTQEAKQAWLRTLADTEPHLVVNTGDNLAHLDALPSVLDAYGELLDLPGVFVFGSNDYFAPILKNPLKYLTGGTGDASKDGKPWWERRKPTLPFERMREHFTNRGWTDLTNTHASLTIDGRRLAFVGVDDPHLRYDVLDDKPADASADLAIGVAHAPYLRVLDRWNELGYPLILAGHTHGGQLCVPFYGALVTNCDLDRKRASGLHTHATAGHDPSWMHVSAGLGTSPFAPVRFACRPEATLLTLTGIDSAGLPA
jgi:predicted MPP superfamily phosphohydrolase